MKIKGMTAVTGKTGGRARVITKVEDIASLEAGDILVCRMTTAEWLPAFEVVAGVITSEGGSMCHAAIVARNYRKPCIVAAARVMEHVKDGDYISMQANGGSDATIFLGEQPDDLGDPQTTRDIAKYSMIEGRRLSLAELEYYS